MPRVPRPDELPRSTLAGASTPAQINIGVAGAIGAAGRAQGQAIAAIGNAFGEVVGRIGQANDANALADAKLEWLKGDMGIQDDISRNVGEDGALWQSTGDRYAGLNKEIDSKYQISDPQKRRDFDRWRDMQTFERGMGAAKQYQGAQRGLFLKGFDADVAGLEERLQKGEIDPATFGEYYSTLSEKLGSMAGKTINQTDVEAKTKELQGRLTGALDRYLASKAPGERAAFWDQVSKGQYEVDQPQQPGRAGDAKTFLRSKLAPGYEKRTSDVDNLHPVMQDRLAALTAAAEDAGHDVRIISGHRDAKRQAVLWEDALKKYGSADEARKHVAPPGRSSHQTGEAVDLQFGDRGAGLGGKRTAAVEWVHQNAKKYGLSFPLDHEDWHIEPIEVRQGGKRYGGSYDTSKTYWQGGRVAGDAGGAVDFRNGGGPAAIRFNNPGAMYPGPSAKKFGSVETKIIGGGHKIAVFPDAVSGAAAQFDLLASDKYTGLSVEKAIAKWSGGNSVDTYLSVLKREAGVNPGATLTAEMVRDPKFAIPLAKAMARQESGKAYPLSDEQWLKAHQMAFSSGTSPPVAQRGITTVAGLTPSRGVQVADASAAIPASAMPANNNPSQQPQVRQPLLPPEVIGQLSEADGKQLASDVVSMDVLAGLADKSEAVASVESLEAMTVDDLRKIVAEHEVKGLDARAAGGVPAKVIPEGRLLPGQTFSVKTPKGEFKVPSEWINSLTPKMRAEYARQAQRDNAVYQRQLKADADEMMKNQEAHVAEFGKNAPDYDVRAVQAAYGTDPKKLKAHAHKLRVGKAIYDEFRDAASLPDDEIVARLERIRPEMDGVQFAESKEIYEKAEKRLDLLMKERARDPAGAVEKSKDVMSVREKLIGGTPRNKFDWQALMMARLDAQRRLDISEEARSPLTGNELRALAAPLRGMEPEQAVERIEQVHATVKEKYGDRFSGVIMRKVMETTVRDKQRRESFGAMLTELEDDGKVSPTTLRRLREREELVGQEKQVAPKPAAPRSLYSRVMGMMPGTRPGGVLSGNYRMGLENMPAAPMGPRRTPPREAVDQLRQNPGSMRLFESTFGLSPGEGRKYLLRE